jgi:hypothetical protein
MAYATLAQLASYLGVAQSALPSNANILLDRASDLIDYITLGRIEIADAEQAAVAQKATCQQVEYMIEYGEIDKDENAYKSVSIGTFSATFGDKSSGMKTLSPRARRTLFLAGMLYRGVRMI